MDLLKAERGKGGELASAKPGGGMVSTHEDTH